MVVMRPSGPGVGDWAKLLAAIPAMTRKQKTVLEPLAIQIRVLVLRTSLLTLPTNVDYIDQLIRNHALRAISEKFRGKSASFSITSIEPADRHFAAKP